MTNEEQLNDSSAEEVTAAAEAAEAAAEAACEATAEAPADTEAKHAEELETLQNQLLRTMAEYDNFRKRTAREKEELNTIIKTNVTAEFLPVLDNLQRALDAECTDAAYKTGVQMIYDSFMQTLKKLGVEEIDSTGENFNPNLHQAVQRVDSDELESGKIATTFAKGYKIGEKVIRFAMVAVVN